MGQILPLFFSLSQFCLKVLRVGFGLFFFFFLVSMFEVGLFGFVGWVFWEGVYLSALGFFFGFVLGRFCVCFWGL